MTKKKPKFKLFIWDNVDKLTDSWHDSGGLVIVAESVERARELFARPLEAEPDVIRECEGPEVMFVFPDAGCC